MTASPSDPFVPSESGRRYRAPALEKGLDIIELLAARGQPMTASQISAGLDRSMSELFRMIQVLDYRGYIETSEVGEGYALSSKLFNLVMSRTPVRDLIDTALPVMRELTAETGQSCHLGVASDCQTVVVARVESPGCFGFSVRPGFRRNLTDSTTGSVLFAFQAPRTREAWLDRLKLAKGDAVTRAFVARCDAIRALGHEQIPSKVVDGVTDLSAPIMGETCAVAGLTIPFLEVEPEGVDRDEALARLLEAARRIGEALVVAA